MSNVSLAIKTTIAGSGKVPGFMNRVKGEPIHNQTGCAAVGQQAADFQLLK